MRIAAGLFGVVLAVSCSKASSERTAAQPFTNVDEAWQHTKAFWSKIQAAVDASGGDCRKFGTALGPLLPAAKDFMARSKAFEAVPDNLQAMETKYGRELGDLMFPSKKMFFDCKQTPEVAELIAVFKQT